MPMNISRLSLDANTLLNAVFVHRSWSSTVINLAARRKIPIFIGTETRIEAIRTAKAHAMALGKVVDPTQIIDCFIEISRFKLVKPLPCLIPTEIPTHDHHVYAEAITADATVLTSDAGLWAACGSGAVLPLQLLKQWTDNQMNSTLFGIAPTTNSGSVFFRGIPNWNSLNLAREKFYLADFGGQVRLYYDSELRSWIGIVPGIRKLEVKAQVKSTVQTIALSWKVGGKACLRVKGQEHPDQVTLNKEWQGDLTQATVGSSYHQQHHWNGTVSSWVMNDGPIGRDLWKTLCESDVLTPNPYDSDRLKFSLTAALPY